MSQTIQEVFEEECITLLYEFQRRLAILSQEFKLNISKQFSSSGEGGENG